MALNLLQRLRKSEIVLPTMKKIILILILPHFAIQLEKQDKLGSGWAGSNNN